MHRFLIVATASTAVLVAMSCGARADLALRADRSATLSLDLEVPAEVDAKIRQFAATGGAPAGGTATMPLFDAAAVSASVTARGVVAKESRVITSRAYRGVFHVADIERLLASDRELAEILDYARGPGWASLRLRVGRDNAATLAGLFPGLDAELIEALQPPALYDNPVSPAEYRSMLAGLLGKAAVGAIDGLSFTLSTSLPGGILEWGGAAKVDAARKTASLSVPAIEAMVLDRPIEFYIKWKE